MDWKHLVLSGVMVLLPVEVHFLMGVDWTQLAPAYASTIVGVLQFANEILTNLPKDTPKP